MRIFFNVNLSLLPFRRCKASLLDDPCLHSKFAVHLQRELSEIEAILVLA